jgi:hypothetical protein
MTADTLVELGSPLARNLRCPEGRTTFAHEAILSRPRKTTPAHLEAPRQCRARLKHTISDSHTEYARTAKSRFSIAVAWQLRYVAMTQNNLGKKQERKEAPMRSNSWHASRETTSTAMSAKQVNIRGIAGD